MLEDSQVVDVGEVSTEDLERKVAHVAARTNQPDC
jgi:hypothetical protein